MPFGEEVTADATYRKADLKYGAVDNIRQKFTGYQRDEETGLDFAEARYYNNNHGRFTAVDPLLASGKSANPQTFNRYAYTMNRPLILSDPTGLQAAAEKRSVTVQASDITPTAQPVSSSFDTTIEGYPNVSITTTFSGNILNQLNSIQTEIETLAVAQKENYRLATEYGAASINQADSSSIALELVCFVAQPGLGIAMTITNPLQNVTPESAAYWYTDSMGQLNMPGTTNAAQIGGGIAPSGIGPTGGIGTEQNLPLGEGASVFQSAANSQQLLIDSLTTNGAAERFANVNSGGGSVTYTIKGPNGSPFLPSGNVGNAAELLKEKYKVVVQAALDAAERNPYIR